MRSCLKSCEWLLKFYLTNYISILSVVVHARNGGSAKVNCTGLKIETET